MNLADRICIPVPRIRLYQRPEYPLVRFASVFDLAAHVAIAHSAIAAGNTLGLDAAALKDIVKVSSGRSFGFEVYARLPNPFAFAHGAKMLLKDVRLLNEVLGSDPAFTAFREVALPFLEHVQAGAAGRSSA